MRVLLVSHCFPPDNLAGVELYTANVADRLARAGHEVAVLTRRLAPGVTRATVAVEARASGVTVHRVVREASAEVGASRLARDLDAPTARVVDGFRPELVHVTHLMHHAPRLVEHVRRSGAGLVLSLLDFFTVCPRVHLRRTDGGACDGPRRGAACVAHCFADRARAERRRWRQRARRLEHALAAADRVLCPSLFVHDYFLPRVGDVRRLETLPLGINEAPSPGHARPPRTESSDVLEVAFVGALVPHKGCDVIVEALSLAKLVRSRLRVIGQSPDAAYRAAIESRARAVPGLELVFHPPFPPGDLPRLLEGADVVVVPSRVEETFSLVAREALACGIPVVASRLGALPEIVRDGVNGRLFDPARPQELADELLRLARDPARLASLAAGAAATVIPRLDAHVEALVGIYRDVVANRRPFTVAERVRGLLRRR